MPKVQITQHIRPFNEKRTKLADVSEELFAKVHYKNRQMRFDCEILSTGDVAVWGRWNDESEASELLELADNGPRGRFNLTPQQALEKIINELWQRRDGFRLASKELVTPHGS